MPYLLPSARADQASCSPERAPTTLLRIMALALALGASAGGRLPAQERPSADSLLHLSRERQVFALARVLSADSTLGGDVRACLLGQVHAAFRQLRPALDQLGRCSEQAHSPDLVRQALERMVPVHLALGQAADAAAILTRLLAAYGRGAADDSAGWESGLTLMRALSQGAPMHVVTREPSRVPAHRNVLGMLLVPVRVNNRDEELLLDTGAGLSVLTTSLAESLAVRLVPGSVAVSGGTGARMSARLGLARLALAGVVLDDVPFLVLPDSVLRVRAGPLQLQVRGIVGLPVLVALEEVRLSREGWLEVPAEPRVDGPANLAMDGQRLLVEATLDGRAGVFTLDTGARSTTLYPLARSLLPARRGAASDTMELGSAGGTRSLAVERLDAVRVGVGDTALVLYQVPLVLEPPNSRARFAAGNLGQDVFGAFPVATFNFRRMVVRLGADDLPLSVRAAPPPGMRP